jgi:hypothetical protein
VKSKGEKWAPHAIRLRVLRKALFNETSSEFARRLKVSPQRLGNMENGHPLSIDVANKIRFEAPGMTLDWLYHADERLIPDAMLRRLRDEAVKADYISPRRSR